MLSNGNGNSEDKTFINLKLTATPWVTTEVPKFTVVGEDFKLTDEAYSGVKGKLIKIKGSFTPAKGHMGDIYGFKAFLEDWEEIYVIESTITNASKDLLNALLVNVGQVLKVKLYLNKNGYPTSSVKLEDGNWAQTAFEFNQIDNKELYNKVVELEKAGPEAEPDKEEGVSVSDIPFN